MLHLSLDIIGEGNMGDQFTGDVTDKTYILVKHLIKIG